MNRGTTTIKTMKIEQCLFTDISKKCITAAILHHTDHSPNTIYFHSTIRNLQQQNILRRAAIV